MLHSVTQDRNSEEVRRTSDRDDANLWRWFSLMVCTHGVAGAPDSGYTWAQASTYGTGLFNIVAGYMHTVNAGVTNAKRAAWSSTTDSLFDGVVNTGYRTSSSLNIVHAAGSYKLGGFTFGGGYRYSVYNHDAQSVSVRQEHYHSGKTYVSISSRLRC